MTIKLYLSITINQVSGTYKVVKISMIFSYGLWLIKLMLKIQIESFLWISKTALIVTYNDPLDFFYV